MLKNKIHLLTGGAGLVGSHIADELVREGAKEIRIFDDFSRGTLKNLEWALANGNVRIIKASVTDREALLQALEGVDTVFHLAAIRITRCAQDPLAAHDILGTGTINVFHAAAQAKVRKVVASSSASVYGQADAFPTNETHHPYNNDTLYGALKCYLEGIAKAYHQTHGLPYLALRYFNIYGPRMDAEGKYTEVMIRWMERCQKGEPPVIFGDGKQTMDFVFVGDVARANILAAKSSLTEGSYNIARGEETSLLDLAIGISKAMGCAKAPEFAEERSVSAVRRRLADTSAALRDLGFKAEVPLDEGLRRLVSWWKSLKTDTP